MVDPHHHSSPADPHLHEKERAVHEAPCTNDLARRLANEAPAAARSLFLRRGACGSERPDLAPTAARGLLHVLDAVALATTSGVPNMSPNATITARIDVTQRAALEHVNGYG